MEFKRKASKVTEKFLALETERMELSFFQDRNDSRRHRFRLKDRNLVLDILSLKCLLEMCPNGDTMQTDGKTSLQSVERLRVKK